MIRQIKLGLVLSLLSVFSACDHGLEPSPAAKPGFGGRISYKGKWPPSDSVKLIGVLAFRNLPPFDIVEEYLKGNIVFDTTLSKNVDFQNYQLFTEPTTFRYVIVAQQYGATFFESKVIGVYTDEPEAFTPKSVSVTEGFFVADVDIAVDFDHLPPQVLVKRTPR
ncbi:MAG: hypothetical protein AAB393_13995 [Bacteroidota bacterium]